MRLRLVLLPILSYLHLCSALKDEEKIEPCTITHPHTKEFYDLRGLTRHADEEHAADWHANGYDYAGGNFSLNICAPLITKTTRLSKTQNISAIYTDEEERMFSIGRTSTKLTFRGKKLTIKYEGGSACPGDTEYRKSSIILFTCDPTMIGTASVNFIGESNECSYFFEYKTSRACATTRDVEAALSPAYVFLIILIVALGVYFVGGCMYSRTVLHQTGWRQLPNHEVWQGLFRFINDMAVIVLFTVIDKTNSLLAACGIRQAKQPFRGLPGNYDSRYDVTNRLDDDDNQLIDDLEDDRW